jgi:hypothetical protein
MPGESKDGLALQVGVEARRVWLGPDRSQQEGNLVGRGGAPETSTSGRSVTCTGTPPHGSHCLAEEAQLLLGGDLTTVRRRHLGTQAHAGDAFGTWKTGLHPGAVIIHHRASGVDGWMGGWVDD